jgi:hypothetical protein
MFNFIYINKKDYQISFNKSKFMIMFIFRIYFSWIRQRFRSLSLIKIILLILSLFIIVIYLLFFNKKNRWCDPEESLWWFCSWPGDETVCSWEEHFPTTPQNLR